jgi:hypothetical protein
MEAFSVWNLFLVVLILVIPTWLFTHVIVKAGFSPWWAALGMIPAVNLIALCVFALVDWPSFPKQRFPDA